MGSLSSWLKRCSSRLHPRGGCPAPCVRMQLCFSQNRSSLNRFQTVPFSTCSTNFASHLLNWMTSGSTMLGICSPLLPSLRQSMSSPLSVIVMFPISPPRDSPRSAPLLLDPPKNPGPTHPR